MGRERGNGASGESLSGAISVITSHSEPSLSDTQVGVGAGEKGGTVPPLWMEECLEGFEGVE